MGLWGPGEEKGRDREAVENAAKVIGYIESLPEKEVELLGDMAAEDWGGALASLDDIIRTLVYARQEIRVKVSALPLVNIRECRENGWLVNGKWDKEAMR